MRKHVWASFILSGFCLFLVQGCSSGGGREERLRDQGQSVPREVVLTPEAARTAGLRTETAEVRSFSPVVKASGNVVFNQKKYARVTPRVAGRVERVLAFAGDKLRAGQDLVHLFSPDAMTAQTECLQILARISGGSGSARPEDVKLYIDLLQSAEAKLRLMGFDEAGLDALRKDRKPLAVLAVKAPFSGTVVETEVSVGSAVEPGTCLAEMADLSTLWVQVNIFEKDLAMISPGTKAEISVAAWPGDRFGGVLTMVGSVMDTATRTVQGRVEVPNPEGKLKPGMFAEVRMTASRPVSFLAVPDEAVRSVAGKTTVFVESGTGRFLLREVLAGRTMDGRTEILGGLAAGERVVSAGSLDVKAEWLKATLEGGHE